MEKPKSEKLYRLIQTISIILMFVSVALVVLMSFKYIKYTSAMLALVCIILTLSLSCMMALPWVKQLTNGEFKTLCIVMLSVVGACCILWIVGIVVVINMIDAIDAGNEAFNVAGSLRFLKIDLILTFQFVVASFIASCVVKYRKTMIAFQAISYISNLYIDFYGSYALACCRIVDNKFQFTGSAAFITNRLAIMFAVMALLFVIVSSFIINRMDRRRQREALAPMYDDVGKKKVSGEKSVQQKMKELKEMLDNNLISEEEYAKKRDELIDQL